MVRRAIYKLVGATTLMPLAVLGLRFTHFDVFFFVFVIAFILSILWSVDVGRLLRAIENPTWGQRLFGILLGVPQALFGLVCMLIGGSVITYVIWNNFFNEDPRASWIFTFGLAPTLVLFGAAWIVYAFRREPVTADNPDEELDR